MGAYFRLYLGKSGNSRNGSDPRYLPSSEGDRYSNEKHDRIIIRINQIELFWMMKEGFKSNLEEHG